MAIVLAIEPDRRQAAHLAAIVRHQVHAELLIADTTEGALDAIGNRIPDLVLVPALLSPQDDAALAAALRVIAAAAHVRTLTIPVLASGVSHAPKLGMLAKWRKGRDASPEPDGCDPAVFAEQISAYLQEAAAARVQLDDDRLAVEEPVVRSVEPPPAVEPEWDEPIAVAGDAPQPWVAAPIVEETQSWAARPIVEETKPWAAAPIVEETEPWAARPIVEETQRWAAAPIVEEPAAVLARVAEHAGATVDLEEPSVDLSDELEGMSGDEDLDADGELFDGERVGVYTISADPEDIELDRGNRPLEMAELPGRAEPLVEAAAAASHDDDLAVREIAAWSGFAAPSVIAEFEPEPLFVEPPEPPRAHVTSWTPMYLTPGRMWPALEGMPAEMPVARTEQPDWIELVASLRQDLERRRTDQAPAAVDRVAARPSEGGEPPRPYLAKKQSSPVKKARPVQDEWGFFDPEQCGFSTLLAKLDEITEDVPGA